MDDESLTVRPAPAVAESPRDIDALPADDPAHWFSSHSGWRKWSRWSNGAPLRAVYQEGAAERRRLVGQLLDPGEEVLCDGPAYLVDSPESGGSDPSSGHLLVATKRLIYVPEDERVLTLRFSQMRSVNFVKQKSGWITIEVITDLGKPWAIVVLPRIVRSLRRSLKKFSPGALQ